MWTVTVLLAALFSVAAARGCGGRQMYNVTFEGAWGEDRFDDMVPSGAVFTPFAVASHRCSEVLFTMGALASPEVEAVAEGGDTGPLFRYWNNLKRNIVLDKQLLSNAALEPTGAASAMIEFKNPNPCVSGVAMIAPSPDWFVGISNFELCDRSTGDWMEVEFELFALDAGTEDGLDFNTSNPATFPPMGIQQIFAQRVPGVFRQGTNEIPYIAKLRFSPMQ